MRCMTFPSYVVFDIDDLRLRSNNVIPEMKSLQATWRDRLPESWDSLHTWDSLLLWRIHVFHSIRTTFTTALHPTDVGQMAGLHDTPWTVIRLAKAARKHRLPDLTLAALSRLHSLNTMDVKDAFHRMREQILSCFASPSELRGGLNIIITMNLEFFNDAQRAELFHLKGKFQRQLGDLGEAQQSFSQVCNRY